MQLLPPLSPATCSATFTTTMSTVYTHTHVSYCTPALILYHQWQYHELLLMLPVSESRSRLPPSRHSDTILLLLQLLGCCHHTTAAHPMFPVFRFSRAFLSVAPCYCARCYRCYCCPSIAAQLTLMHRCVQTHLCCHCFHCCGTAAAAAEN